MLLQTLFDFPFSIEHKQNVNAAIFNFNDNKVYGKKVISSLIHQGHITLIKSGHKDIYKVKISVLYKCYLFLV